MRSVNASVADEIRSEYTKSGIDEHGGDARPQVTRRRKSVQQKNRRAIPIVFHDHRRIRQLDRLRHRITIAIIRRCRHILAMPHRDASERVRQVRVVCDSVDL